MWLVVYIPAVLGVLRYRHWRYWRWVCALLAWQATTQFLFSGGGTLEAPARDGLVSRLVRQATDDGPGFALYAIGSLLIFYGGVAYFIRQLYRDAKSDRGASAGAPRKGLELLALTLVCGALLYDTFTSARSTATRAMAETADQRTLETELDKAVALVNKQTPLKLDAVTVLTRVSREGRMLLYDYSVAGAPPREEFSDFLQSEVMAQGCANTGNQDMLRAGATIRYRYQLESGGAPLSLDITADLCQRLGTRDPAPQKNSSISR